MSHFVLTFSVVFAVKLQKCFVDYKLHLSSHQQGGEEIVTEFTFWGELFL